MDEPVEECVEEPVCDTDEVAVLLPETLPLVEAVLETDDDSVRLPVDDALDVAVWLALEETDTD